MCIGAFVDSDTLEITRCDECKVHAYDEDAALHARACEDCARVLGEQLCALQPYAYIGKMHARGEVARTQAQERRRAARRTYTGV